MKHQIILILALLLVTAGCGPAPTGVGAEIVSQAIKTQSATAEATVGGFISTKTVVDSRSGIAFDYPVNWTLLEPSADDGVIYTYSVASYDLSNPSSASQNGLPSGQTKIDISFYGADETPDSARRTVQADVDSGMAVIEKEETRAAPDGSVAYYYVIQGRLGGTAQVLYTRVNGHTVGVVAYGEGMNFDEVIKSLRAA